MTPGERIVASCEKWLSPGPLGDKLRPDDYRQLIACGFDPPLTSLAADIGAVRTSCAIFVRAILHDSGVLLAKRPGRIGDPFWGGWLGVLSPRHRAWVKYHGVETPVPGAVFYIESPANPNNNHTGFFIGTAGTGAPWRTAEGGGGGDGTKCQFTQRQMGRDFAGNRRLVGWFDPDLIPLPVPRIDDDDEPTQPETPHSLTPVASQRVLYRGLKGADVSAWQEQLRSDGWVVKPDGIFGTQTDAATRGWQASRGLTIDGVVGPQTRAAIGTPPKRSSSTSLPAVKPEKK